MLPVVELRGAIPYGFAFGLPWLPVMLVSMLGNLIPVPFIIIFIRKIFNWLKGHSRIGAKIRRLEEKALKKAGKVTAYRFIGIGLFVFVAIPLPGTGAWTGALIAAMLDMRLKTAFPAIAAGVLTAGVIVSAMTYGVSSVFGLS